MFAPLPFLYRIVVSVLAVLTCLGLGAWLTFVAELPVLTSVGAGVGAALGLVASYVLVHDFHHRQTQRVVVRRHD